MKAMILAAGLGTRLRPLTADRPKALVEIGRKTLLERCILYLKAFNIHDITINIHHFGSQIIDFLHRNDNFGVTINISDETGMLLGTGGALLKARPFLKGDDDILLINVDVLTNLNIDDLAACHKRAGALATLVVRERITTRYLLFDGKGQLAGWKNTTSGLYKKSNPESMIEHVALAFSGIHIIDPELLNQFSETGKFSVTDLYLRLAATQKIIAFIDKDSLWMDLGKYDDITLAEQMAGQIDL